MTTYPLFSDHIILNQVTSVYIPDLVSTWLESVMSPLDEMVISLTKLPRSNYHVFLFDTFLLFFFFLKGKWPNQYQPSFPDWRSWVLAQPAAASFRESFAGAMDRGVRIPVRLANYNHWRPSSISPLVFPLNIRIWRTGRCGCGQRAAEFSDKHCTFFCFIASSPVSVS